MWVKYRVPCSGKVGNIYIYSNLCIAGLMSDAYVILKKKLGDKGERREKLT